MLELPWNMSNLLTSDSLSRIISTLESADFNDDGIDDIIFHNSLDNSVVVVFGRSDQRLSNTYSLDDLASNEYIVLSETGFVDANSKFGETLTTGDFNGDGFTDIAVGSSSAHGAGEDAPGSVSIFYGRSKTDTDQLLVDLAGGPWTANSFDGSDGQVIFGDVEEQHFGATVHNLGDHDGDGRDDLAISDDPRSGNPNLFIYYGNDDHTNGSLQIADIAPNNLATLTGFGQDILLTQSVPFEAITPLTEEEINTNPQSLLVGEQGADLFISFRNLGGPDPSIILSGDQIQRGTSVNIATLGISELITLSYAVEDNRENQGLVFADISSDLRPEAWVNSIGSGGRVVAIDWGYVPPLDGNGDPLPDVGFDPDTVNEPGIEVFNADPAEVRDTQFGAGLIAADFFGDAYRGYNMFAGELRQGFENIDDIDTLDLFMDHGLFETFVHGVSFARPYADNALVEFGGIIDIGRNQGFTNNPITDPNLVDGTNGYRILGTESEHGLGLKTAAGDINGDGITDLLFGAQFYPHDSGNDGAIHVLTGGEKNLRAQDAQDGMRDGLIQVASLNSTAVLRAGLVITDVEADAFSGFSVSSAGDLNNDGLKDILIGNPFSNGTGPNGAGDATVIYGSYNFDGPTIDRSGLQMGTGVRIQGEAFGDTFSYSMSSIGDVNGDGFDDIAFGSPYTSGSGENFAGRAYVIYGADGSLPLDIDLTTLTAAQGMRFQGNENGALSGRMVSGLGDINGDGRDDFIISAQGADGSGTDAGQAFVIFGRDGDLGLDLSPADLDGTNGFVIQGDVANGRVSEFVVNAGDLNGDGLNDILIGSNQISLTHSGGEGALYALYGSTDPFPSVVDLGLLTPAQSALITGEPAGQLGRELAAGGDFNGDGRTDILVGLNTVEPGVGVSTKDTIALVFGSADGLPSMITPQMLTGENGMAITAQDSQRSVGSDLAFAGDVNGDGYDDLLIAARDQVGSTMVADGGAYLLFGRPDALPAEFDLADINGRNGYFFSSDNPLPEDIAVSGLGDVDGDGRDDFAISVGVAPVGQNSEQGKTMVVFGGAVNLAALDLADGTADGTIMLENLSVAYTEDPRVLAGDGRIHGTFLDDTMSLGFVDLNGDAITKGGDFIISAEGADLVFGNDGNDVIRGGTGNDTLSGQGDHDILQGEDGNDSLFGGAGQDFLDAGAGNDSLNGGLNADTLVSGAGNDTLTGGDGADEFYISADSTTVLITDFELGVDQLALADFQRDVALDAFMNAVEGSVIMTFAGGPVVTIEGHSPATFAASNVGLGGANLAPTGDLVINNAPVLGTTLVADMSGVSDPEGIPDNGVTYQWFRDGQSILGANSNSYTLINADLSAQISVTASYTDLFGTPETVTSAAVGPVDVPNALPQGNVTISGIAAEDQILTADASGVTDADGINLATAQFQWFRDGNPIVGEMGQTYTLGQLDVGTDISVAYQFDDNTGRAEEVFSAPLQEIQNVNDDPLGTLDIGGDVEINATVTAIVSGITDDDGMDPNSFTFSWTRSDDAAGTGAELIVGEAGQTYKIQASDAGHFLQFSFTYTDTFGHPTTLDLQPTYINSPTLGQVTLGRWVEEGTEITLDPSVLDDPDGLGDGGFSYQWFRDGAVIAGATQATYTPTAVDVGENLSAQIKFVDGAGTTETHMTTDHLVAPAPQIVNGTPAGEALQGATLNTIINAFEGDDTLEGFEGDDRFYGDDGQDTVVFSNDQTSYQVQISPTGTTIQDKRLGIFGTGNDELHSIEYLDFATEIPLFANDGRMHLDIFDGPAQLTAEAFGQLTELYIAYFNRAPDALGLFYWGSQLQNGMSVQDIADNFFLQDETQLTYAASLDAQGNLADIAAFVTAVYTNVLGRAADQDGFDYWVDELQNNPAIGPANFILSIINGAKFPSDPTPQTAIDQAYLETKTDIGVHFAVISGLSNIQDAKDVMALYDGTLAGGQLVAQNIDSLYSQALDPVNGEFIIQLVGVLDEPFA